MRGALICGPLGCGASEVIRAASRLGCDVVRTHRGVGPELSGLIAELAMNPTAGPTLFEGEMGTPDYIPGPLRTSIAAFLLIPPLVECVERSVRDERRVRIETLAAVHSEYLRTKLAYNRVFQEVKDFKLVASEMLLYLGMRP